MKQLPLLLSTPEPGTVVVMIMRADDLYSMRGPDLVAATQAAAGVPRLRDQSGDPLTEWLEGRAHPDRYGEGVERDHRGRVCGTTSQALAVGALGIQSPGRSHEMKACKLLKGLGWEGIRPSKGRNRKRVWRRQ